MDMIFVENGNLRSIIAKGLNFEHINGTGTQSKEFGGLSVYDGHPNGPDLVRKK